MTERQETPVMLLFFNRPEPLKEVFQWVRTVKPKQLFLVQDGARPGRDDDVEKVRQCREVVENIDWPCEVYRNYSEENLSCDPREFSGISWCFEYVDRLIILEDDCVPSISFYQFCAELLEKYKDDERVHAISGMNRVGVYENYPYDYIPSTISLGWGWATWKRTWEKAEQLADMKHWADQEFVQAQIPNLKYTVGKSYGCENFPELGLKWKRAYEERHRVESWEFAIGSVLCLNGTIALTPTKNMIKNIGVTEDATHSADANLLPRRVRKLFNMQTYEIEFPMKEPPFLIREVRFENEDYRVINQNGLWKCILLLEKLFLYVRYGQWKRLTVAIQRKFKREP